MSFYPPYHPLTHTHTSTHSLTLTHTYKHIQYVNRYDDIDCIAANVKNTSQLPIAACIPNPTRREKTLERSASALDRKHRAREVLPVAINGP